MVALIFFIICNNSHAIDSLGVTGTGPVIVSGTGPVIVSGTGPVIVSGTGPVIVSGLMQYCLLNVLVCLCVRLLNVKFQRTFLVQTTLSQE